MRTLTIVALILFFPASGFSISIEGTFAGVDRIESEITYSVQDNGNADGSEEEEVSAEDEVRSEIAELRELISFSKIFYALFLLFITYFINKYLTIIIDNLSEKTTNYRLFIKRLAPISRIIIGLLRFMLLLPGLLIRQLRQSLRLLLPLVLLLVLHRRIYCEISLVV